jgi:HEAT repeat protein
LIAVGYALASMGASSAGAGSSPQFVVEEVGIDPVTGDVVARLSNGDGEMLRGGLEQPDVQSALVSAVRQQGDLRIRLHALRTVEQGAATSFSESDPLVRAMLEVLRTENSDAVRLRAVQALDRLFEGEELPASARETLLSVVTGAGGPAVRIAALDALVTRRLSPESTESLVRLAESDPNSYVRLTAAAALDAAGPLESVP